MARGNRLDQFLEEEAKRAEALREELRREMRDLKKEVERDLTRAMEVLVRTTRTGGITPRRSAVHAGGGFLGRVLGDLITSGSTRRLPSGRMRISRGQQSGTLMQELLRGRRDA